MNKDGFIDQLSRETGITKVAAEMIVDAGIQIIKEAMVSGDRVQFLGFGTFETKVRAPRVGRNPRANTPVNIPEKRVPVFKPGKPLKDAVGEMWV